MSTTKVRNALKSKWFVEQNEFEVLDFEEGSKTGESGGKTSE